MRLTFLGAAREVTGSCILVETGGKKILLECGFFQGHSLAEERNYLPFPFDVSSVDFMIVCHAHLDHVGRIPKLVRDGFRGKIFSTAPTKEITQLVLEDSFKLMNEGSKRDNHAPLYSQRDIEATIQLFETIGYGQELEIFDNISLTLRNAGHILGSAVCVLGVEGKTLVYSSDLGNVPSALLPPPDKIERADIVVCESTYGSRVHEDISKRSEKLNSIINLTIAQNGVLVIPTFAIERAQELLHDIEHFCRKGNCSIPMFFLDSPLADKVTKVFNKYGEFLSKKVNLEHVEDIFGLSRVKITSTVDQSKEINSAPKPKVIMAGSGMLNGGRILYHLQNYIEDAKNTVLIVGYQAKGTLGRKLLDGEEVIRIFGKKYHVRANVKAIGSYSAHADSLQLLNWIGGIAGIKKVFLVHGEVEEALAFSRTLRSKINADVEIPQLNEQCEL